VRRVPPAHRDTGAERALGLKDADGVSMAEAMTEAGLDVGHVGTDVEALGRVGTFVELHVEQGRGLIDLGRAVAVASSICARSLASRTRREANHADDATR